MNAVFRVRITNYQCQRELVSGAIMTFSHALHDGLRHWEGNGYDEDLDLERAREVRDQFAEQFPEYEFEIVENTL